MSVRLARVVVTVPSGLRWVMSGEPLPWGRSGASTQRVRQISDRVRIVEVSG